VVVGLFGGFTKTVPTSTPLFMVGKTVSEGGSNRTNKVDAKLQDLVDKAYGASTETEACAAWKEFNTYSIQNSVVMPWASSVTHWFSPKATFAYEPVSSYIYPVTLRRLK
jgi:hypothetical protein